MLLDEGLAGERPDALVNLHPRGIRPEEGGARPQGQVLDVENGPPGLPKGGEQFPGLGRGLGSCPPTPWRRRESNHSGYR